MRTLIVIAAFSLLAGPASAADHLFTATSAGGLTTSSQPFMNGINNSAPTADAVPGQGSPLSGDEHTVPATDTQTGASLRTPPSVTQGKTAPSAKAR
ncbi:hypothetical protein FJ492_00395 [Mesorhizobium sp. B2-5-4]|uniref:DUF680 domain-containing protein n=1 Tax=Mesorhizobium salmacidum TaxID=3015171 RepID=A0ABU8KUG6_9HYPH|nr:MULTISPECIES: hypothetical protein [unclassified Mesorhizobium]TPJ38731.1 hypothetical protein FJ432_21775 [Mesorhizobium sp. B2-6-5]TPJ79755.1 hypothetical protein FJ434_22800 [Mesorhizobium sp. B2-5-13]TPK40160.1 hypothetical protein FJ560_28625 [Mesorhizobium sp. B2-5-5]TPK49593.1 hypothetical protein FJ492_00395 [Mesorhizobium sp. B2-5-4]TPL90920.1 hypothetical protein FJ941_02415 [Mesorhizobium sp. B2-3-13]